ncbi:Uncharacterised protein [[Clostridium] sordellii]|uniref:hypothetical protein n=1 Tax=Paraclostridium sordellii TaxID=1505 RepID=UPI0005DAB037|nr:hypothetical protein [Paeniclostridium sordellii]CEP94652.1 Uncharacterised protein [[Clostridium] sordellii] [Paeniclostridium sordellii]
MGRLKYKYKNEEYNIFTINYKYKNGFKGVHRILSKCNSKEQLKDIIDKQLNRANRAKFRVIYGKRIINGWLLKMDVESFEIE